MAGWSILVVRWLGLTVPHIYSVVSLALALGRCRTSTRFLVHGTTHATRHAAHLPCASHHVFLCCFYYRLERLRKSCSVGFLYILACPGKWTQARDGRPLIRLVSLQLTSWWWCPWMGAANTTDITTMNENVFWLLAVNSNSAKNEQTTASSFTSSLWGR